MYLYGAHTCIYTQCNWPGCSLTATHALLWCTNLHLYTGLTKMKIFWKDTCISLSDNQSSDTMDPKNCEFHLLLGRKKNSPAGGETCLLERDLTPFSQLEIRLRPRKWWVSSGRDHTRASKRCAHLFKLQGPVDWSGRFTVLFFPLLKLGKSLHSPLFAIKLTYWGQTATLDLGHRLWHPILITT